MVPKCLECDAYAHKPHHPSCSEALPAPPPPLKPDIRCYGCGTLKSPVMFYNTDVPYCKSCIEHDQQT